MWRGLIAVVFLAACQTEDPPKPTVILPGLDIECNGTQTWGGHGQPICIETAPDAGKACQSSADCAGSCLADGQVCSPEAPYYGCYDTYENGTIATLCVD